MRGGPLSHILEQKLSLLSVCLSLFSSALMMDALHNSVGVRELPDMMSASEGGRGVMEKRTYSK